MAYLNTPAINCAKGLIFVLNVVFLIVAIILLAVGIKFYHSYANPQIFLETEYFSSAAIVITVGVLLLLISFIGYLGVVKESVCMVNMYSFALTILLILEISAAITAFIISSKAFNMIQTNMENSMGQYSTNSDVKQAWDGTQEKFHCCGIHQPLDWASKNVAGVSVGLNGTVFNIPQSCCVDTTHCSNLVIYSSGCWDALKKNISSAAHILGYSVLNIAILQLIGIIFSAMLVKYLRKAKSLQEMSRQTTLSGLYQQHQKIVQEGRKNNRILSKNIRLQNLSNNTVAQTSDA